jgi:hypothetical protein
MIFLEHIVVLVEVLLCYFFESVPQSIQTKVAKEKTESMNKLINERLAMYQFIGRSIIEDKTLEDVERATSAQMLATRYKSQFGYNPYLLLAVVISPFLCINLGISQLIFIPVCVLLFSYLKNSKDRHDMMTAAGIISDTNVRHLLFDTDIKHNSYWYYWYYYVVYS